MVAPAYIGYTLIAKWMFGILGILVALNYVVHLGADVDLWVVCVWWEEMYLSLESPSPCESASWWTWHCHVAVTTGANGTQEAGGVRGSQSIWPLLSLFRVGERQSLEGPHCAFLLSFYILGFSEGFPSCLFSFVQKILSTCCLHTVIETCLSNGAYTLIIIMCATATPKSSFLVLG